MFPFLCAFYGATNVSANNKTVVLTRVSIIIVSKLKQKNKNLEENKNENIPGP